MPPPSWRQLQKNPPFSFVAVAVPVSGPCFNSQAMAASGIPHWAASTTTGWCWRSDARRTFSRHSDFRFPGRAQGLGARFGIYFGVTDEIHSYRGAANHDREKMLQFVAAAIAHGVYFHDYGGAACHHGFASQ